MDDIFNKARKEAIKFKREAKRTLELETPLERNIREATSNENWGCANSILYDIAVAAQDYSDRQKIMKKIREFLDEKPHKWRRILKTLNLVDYLLKNGTDRTVDDCLGEQYTVRRLERFSYSEEGKDRGSAVREKAKAISEMMGSKDALRQAREEAKAHREKFGGMHSNTIEGRASKPSDSGGFRMEQSISKSNFDAKFNELKRQKEEASKSRDVRDVRYDRQQRKEAADDKSPRDRGAERKDDRAEDRSDDRGAGRNRRKYDDDDDEEDRRARSKTPDDDDDDFDFGRNAGSRDAMHGDLLDTGDAGGSLLEQGGGSDDFFSPNWQSAAVAPPPQQPQQQAQIGVMDLFSAPVSTGAPAAQAAPLEFAAPAAPSAAGAGDFEFGDFVGQSAGAQGQPFQPGLPGPPMGMQMPTPMQAPQAPMFSAPGPMGTSAASGYVGAAPPMAGFAGAAPVGGPPMTMGMQPSVAMPSVAYSGGAQPAQTVPKDTFLGDVGGLCDLTIETAARPDFSKGAGKGGQGMPTADASKPAELDFGNPFAASGF